VRAYPDAVAYLRKVRATGLAVAVVTSSTNAESVLSSVALDRCLDACVDGRVIGSRGLRGKPAPDAYLAGADVLGASPSHSAVFEDAVAGVAGGFGVVVGVDRVRDGTHAAELRWAGADVVTSDLAELRWPSRVRRTPDSRSSRGNYGGAEWIWTSFRAWSVFALSDGHLG
jgi:beta-phosphoglucomutase-like phosphatase (HAD superfamily)